MGIFSHDEDYITEEYVKYGEFIEVLEPYFNKCIKIDFNHNLCWEKSCTPCMSKLIQELYRIYKR